MTDQKHAHGFDHPHSDHHATPTPTDGTPTPTITSRLTTDGTRYLPETYETTDGTRELPHPMMDPQGVRRRLPDQWPLGDPRHAPIVAPRPA